VSVTEQRAALEPVRRYIGLLVAFLAAITCTFGNLAAYGQTNVKRLMAYSTISHAGYMMMPVAAAMFLAGSHPANAAAALAVVAVYTGLYLFMNLGAFAIIAFLRNTLRSEEIADYAGLVRRSPGVVICFATIMFSLIGLPPLAGFVAKFLVFSSLVDAMSVNVGGSTMLTLLVIGGLNTVVSLFYYVRVVKVMTLDPEPEHRPPAQFSMVSLPGAFIAAMTVPVVALGIWWNGVNEILRAATERLLN
jgi:NADH-quinone oxidoreductase subunit N